LLAEDGMCDRVNRRVFLSVGIGLLTLPAVAQISGCKGNDQREPERNIFSDPKFELLDLALQHEFGAVVQYINHAGVITALNSDPGDTITKTFEKIICEEVRHSIHLSDILKKNDIEPTVAVWPPQTAATALDMVQKRRIWPLKAEPLLSTSRSWNRTSTTHQSTFLKSSSYANKLIKSSFPSSFPRWAE
jgi:rubrerythrin